MSRGDTFYISNILSHSYTKMWTDSYDRNLLHYSACTQGQERCIEEWEPAGQQTTVLEFKTQSSGAAFPGAWLLFRPSYNVNELHKLKPFSADSRGPDTQSAIFDSTPAISNSSKLTMELEEAT